MISDEALYRHYLDGDENALRELVDRYGSALTLYIAGYIRDVHDAEDLMLDAFLRMIMKKPRLLDGCFKAYLFKTARHLALRFAQKYKRGVCFGFEELEHEPEAELLIESIVQTKERHSVLRLCMEKLNRDYREALYLLYLEELSYQEVAEIMGKSKKQIDNLAQRGKKSLRQLLEQEGLTNAHYG